MIHGAQPALPPIAFEFSMTGIIAITALSKIGAKVASRVKFEAAVNELFYAARDAAGKPAA